MGSGVLELCQLRRGVHVLALRDRLDKMANQTRKAKQHQF